MNLKVQNCNHITILDFIHVAVLSTDFNKRIAKPLKILGQIIEQCKH